MGFKKKKPGFATFARRRPGFSASPCPGIRGRFPYNALLAGCPQCRNSQKNRNLQSPPTFATCVFETVLTDFYGYIKIRP
jgi:hypothetical protein